MDLTHSRHCIHVQGVRAAQGQAGRVAAAGGKREVGVEEAVRVLGVGIEPDPLGCVDNFGAQLDRGLEDQVDVRSGSLKVGKQGGDQLWLSDR